MKVVKEVIFYLISTIYLVDVSFFFLPSIIRSRFFLGIIGLCIFLYSASRKKYRVNKYILFNIGCILFLLFPFLLTSIINNNIDAWGFRSFLHILVFFGAYLIIYFKRDLIRTGTYNFDVLVKTIVIIIVVNILIAIFAYFITPIKDFIFSIQGNEVDLHSRNYYASLFRLYGLGTFYFYQGGVYCSWGLILTVYLIRSSKNIKGTFILALAYLLILISGLFIARTVLIGFVFSAIYFLIPKGLNKNYILNSIKKYIIIILFTPFVLFVSINSFELWLNNNIDNRSVAHAFEPFINFFESGHLATESTAHLETMYVFPDNLKTWLIGDGFFTGQDGFYYMHTDVGYLRMVFFFGIIGLLVFYLQKFYLLHSIIKLGKTNVPKNQLLFFLFSFTIVVNLKGFADADPILFLFFWLFIFKHRFSHENNNQYN